MEGLRRIGLALVISALALGKANAAAPQPPEPRPIHLGVDAESDLAEPQQATLAANKPSYLDKPCSFVPAKNPVKPKKNACRFV